MERDMSSATAVVASRWRRGCWAASKSFLPLSNLLGKRGLNWACSVPEGAAQFSPALLALERAKRTRVRRDDILSSQCKQAVKEPSEIPGSFRFPWNLIIN